MQVKFYQDRFEVLQIETSILYFFLLILTISLNFYSDTGYEQDRFSNNLLKKYLKFILNKRNSIVAFNLSFILLLVKVDPISKK